MTLPELASYLSVSERTIYDWAQRGKVPAYKLGAAWRFRKDEIDRWLTTQRSGPPVDTQTERCSVCSRYLTSDRPLAGHCSHADCERPICGTCWGTLRRRSCPAHLTVGDPGTQEDADPTMVSNSKAESVRGRLSAESIRVLSARFLDGFSKRVEGRSYLADSSGTPIARVDSWQWAKAAGTGEPSAKVLRASRRSGRGAHSLETGDWVAYTVSPTKGAMRTGHGTLRLEARVVSATVRRTRRTQATSVSITRSQLDQALDSALSFAKDESVHYVIGLYAPQGWAEEARDLLNHPTTGQRFLHPQLSIALIGTDPDAVVWNDNDPVIVELGPYYRVVPEEEIVQCKERIRELLSVSGVHLVSSIVEEEGFASNVALEAIGALVSAKEIEVVTEQGEQAIVRIVRKE